MALYLYKAIAPGEAAKNVTVEAENQREAEQKLRRLNMLPVYNHLSKAAAFVPERVLRTQVSKN